MSVKRYASRYVGATDSYRELSECYPDETDRGTEYVLASDFDALQERYNALEAETRTLRSNAYSCPQCPDHEERIAELEAEREKDNALIDELRSAISSRSALITSAREVCQEYQSRPRPDWGYTYDAMARMLAIFEEKP